MSNNASKTTKMSPNVRVYFCYLFNTNIVYMVQENLICNLQLLRNIRQLLTRQLVQSGFNCEIKTGHLNLVSCFGPRMRALVKAFCRGESRDKIPCQRLNPRAKTWHKVWMTGLNLNYDTIPIPSLQNSQNKCQKSSFNYDHRRHLILPLPPLHALSTLNARTCC